MLECIGDKLEPLGEGDVMGIALFECEERRKQAHGTREGEKPYEDVLNEQPLAGIVLLA